MSSRCTTKKNEFQSLQSESLEHNKKKKTKENLKILQRSSSVLTVTFTDHVPVDVRSAVAEPAEDPVTLKEESL